MLERWRVAVELFPIRFRDHRFHVLEQRSARERCEHFEKSGRAVQFDGVIDGGANTVRRIREKTDNVEAFRRDLFLPAIRNDFTLVLGRNRPAADALQGFGMHRFDTERDRVETGAVQQIDKRLIEIVETGFALEPDIQLLPKDAFRDGDSAVAVFREERIAEDQIAPPVLLADLIDFRNDVFSGARAIRSRNAVRAVRAVFWTTPARKNRERMRCADGSADGMSAWIEE